MNDILLFIGLISLLLLFFFYFIEPKVSKVKVNNSNEYGSARFATFKEINSTYNKEEIKNINVVGFPIWYSRNKKYVWFDRETPHWCFLGSTGSGKSVTAVIPMCSFIATATKIIVLIPLFFDIFSLLFLFLVFTTSLHSIFYYFFIYL